MKNLQHKVDAYRAYFESKRLCVDRQQYQVISIEMFLCLPNMAQHTSEMKLDSTFKVLDSVSQCIPHTLRIETCSGLWKWSAKVLY